MFPLLKKYWERMGTRKERDMFIQIDNSIYNTDNITRIYERLKEDKLYTPIELVFCFKNGSEKVVSSKQRDGAEVVWDKLTLSLKNGASFVDLEDY
jgi:hypothetical protein